MDQSAMRQMNFRNLSVDGAPFQYFIGKMGTRIRYPDGHCYLVWHNELTGLSWPAIERGRYKRTFSITSKHITDFLRKHGEEIRHLIPPITGQSRFR